VNAIAVFESVGLAGLSLKLATADLRGTCALLSCFGRAYFSETDTQYLFRDEIFAVAVQKATTTFPPVQKILEHTPLERLQVQAGQLTDVLSCFEPLTANRKEPVHLQLELGAEQLQLKARILSRPKNVGSSSLATHRAEDQSTDQLLGTKIKLDYRAVTKLISTGNPNRLLGLEIFPGHIILDDKIDELRTRAIIATIK